MTMRAFRTPVFGLAIVGAALFITVANTALAQGPVAKPPKAAPPAASLTTTPAAPASSPPSGHKSVPGGVVFFETKVGSFKALGSDTTPVQGKLEISFSGTVLVSGLMPGRSCCTCATNRAAHDF